MTILLLANWKPGHFFFRGERIEVDRGELAHSVERIASEAGVTLKTARTGLRLLIRLEVIRVKSGTGTGGRPRVLGVVNYGKYQDEAPPTGTKSGSAAGIMRAPERAPIEEGKEGEQGKQPTFRASKPRGKLGARGPDPRHAAVVARLAAAFSDVKREAYAFQRRDAAANTLFRPPYPLLVRDCSFARSMGFLRSCAA